MQGSVPENLYRGELVQYPGPWAFQLGRAHIILVSDKELEAIADPDKVINLTLTFDKQEGSLRQVCERAKAAGQRTLVIAFDHFFAQYRPGQAGPRKLMPDMDEYIQRIGAISKFAQQYGLGLELSLLSPLEIGVAYAKQTGDHGAWAHYREGVRDPKTGAFSVELWRQLKWVNNKGPFPIGPAGVRVFAYAETPIRGTRYRHVDPKGIVDISQVAKVQVMGSPAKDSAAVRVRIYGKGGTDVAGLSHVLVVQMYKTPEMDYFSPSAAPFLQKLVDKYADAGVKLNALYADEMHIQQDWDYFGHHDNGELALRYVTPNLGREYAKRYGAEFEDFAKYMVYFVHGQEDWARDVSAKADSMHVMDPSPQGVHRTALMRARYYHLLQDGVVDLFANAKRHAEKRMGYRLESRAHATWAESPTIDNWWTGHENLYKNGYEYTSNFVWSNTVHQAASACYDYFKWGDFLTGNGNDHAECGWLDRNYWGLMLACSTGILNDVPYSYGAHWGMPDAIGQRRMGLVNAYGAAGSPLYGMVQDMQHRDVSVMMLYPMDLVAADERFGSWMTQYGYANVITADKLLERGKIANGVLEVAGRRFTTLVATYEPFPSTKLLAMMKEMASTGGRVIWSGPPPVLTAEGDDALKTWQDLFGVKYTPVTDDGVLSPGRQVVFEGRFASLAPQVILTDLLPDRTYPVVPAEGTETVGRVKGDPVACVRALKGGGTTTYLGFRPRDDQSRSLGYETRYWFDILSLLGEYGPTGRFAGVNDNPEHVSRTGQYLTCVFPNGTVAVAPHLREIEEGWHGGFARDKKADDEYLKAHPAPSDAIDLADAKIAGHTVSCKGVHALAFRVVDGELAGFAGSWVKEITVDGKTTQVSEPALSQVAWASVPANRRVPGGAVIQAMVYGEGKLMVPAKGLPGKVTVYAEGAAPGSKGAVVKSTLADGVLSITVDGVSSGRWLYVVPEG